MQGGAPSRTALGAARHRAAHQILENGRIFADPCAVRILGALDDDWIEAEREPARRLMRLFVAARSRLAEDATRHAIASGVRQVVLLGAGLDTGAYRESYGPDVTLYEVDHPATQAWKKSKLAEASLTPAMPTRYVPVDFERKDASLLASLTQAGFQPETPTMFIWLGVVPYLTEAAIRETLAAVGEIPGGAAIIFDYGAPPQTLDPASAAQYAAYAARVAALGEPWITFFEPDLLREILHRAGFPFIAPLDPGATAARLLGIDLPPIRRAGHLVLASTQSQFLRSAPDAEPIGSDMVL